MTSCMNADVSRYAALPLIAAQLRKRVRKQRLAWFARRRLKIEQVRRSRCRPTLGQHLVQGTLRSERNNPGNWMPVVSHVDRLARSDPSDQGADIVSELSDSNTAHGHIVPRRGHMGPQEPRAPKAMAGCRGHFSNSTFAGSEGFNRANPLRPARRAQGGGPVPAGTPPGREPLLLNGGPCASRRVSAIAQSALAEREGFEPPIALRL